MRPIVTWERRGKRVATTVASIVGLTVSLLGFARLIGLPSGYGDAQSLRAPDLAARDDWSDLRRGAKLDIAVFVPAYVVGGIGLTWLVARSRTQRAVVLVPLGVGAVADLVETVLFHRSLTRLLGGATADDIERLANATRIATAFKFGGLVLAAVGLVGVAVRGD